MDIHLWRQPFATGLANTQESHCKSGLSQLSQNGQSNDCKTNFARRFAGLNMFLSSVAYFMDPSEL